MFAVFHLLKLGEAIACWLKHLNSMLIQSMEILLS